MSFHPQLIDRLTPTLVHFLWQGCLLAVLTWLIVEGLGVRSVHRRYALALGFLLACFVLPCITFTIVEPGGRPEIVRVDIIAGTIADNTDEAVSSDITVAADDSGPLPVIIPGPSSGSAIVPTDVVASVDSVSTPLQFEQTVEPLSAATPSLTWLQRNGQLFVLVWACGVALLALRLIVGAASATVLRWRGQPVECDWQAEIDRLARLMNLRRSPSARLSRMVRQVCVVGLYRPVILFPAAWASGVPVEVLEAVIAHELAHIRRHDVWVIHLQRVVETLLFFHPAVWWISRQVSRHRELCCDVDAALVLGSPVRYAKALEYVALKEYSGSQTLFMATLGGKKMELLERIRTVLGEESPRPRRWQGSLAACLMLAGIVTAAASLVRPGLKESHADDESVAVDVSAEEDVEPANTSSEPSLYSPEVTAALERLRAAGMTVEPVCEGSERYRVAGYTNPIEYEGMDRDLDCVAALNLVETVILAEEYDASLDEMWIGRWNQRGLHPEPEFIFDEVDIIGRLKLSPHLRRLVLHDGAIEFITPQSQCTSEELAAIGAECIVLPVVSDTHVDQQRDGVTWRVHSFREKPWLIVVEDVSAGATTAVAEDSESIEASQLSPEEVAAMERLRAAGCVFQDRDGIPIAIEFPVEMNSPMAEDLVVLRNRIEDIRLSEQSITDENLLFHILPALRRLELVDSKLSFRDADSNSVDIEAARIQIEVDPTDSIRSVIAEEGKLLISSSENAPSMQLTFDLMQFDVEAGRIRMEGSTGVGPDGSMLVADSLELDLKASLASQRVVGDESGSNDSEPIADAERTEQVVMTYAVAQFLTPVPGTEGEVTQASIDALKRLISTQVPADSWVDGEVPRIVYHAPTLSLVISQDRATHERIKQFLDDLDLLLGGGRDVEDSSAQESSDAFHTEGDAGFAEQHLADTRLLTHDEQREMVQRLYQRYLQRDPRENEYSVILSRFDRGQDIRDVELDLIGGNEFYSRCEADNSTFIHQLHRQFFDRAANAPEMSYWMSRLEAHGGVRREVASEFLSAVGRSESQSQPAATTDLPIISPREGQASNRDFIEKFYDQFLQRPEQLPEIDMEEFLSRFGGEYRPYHYREFLLSHGVDESELKPLSQPVMPGELALANALNEITSIEADETRLRDVMQLISEQHGINIHVDELALNEIGVASDTPITLTIDGVTLRSALNLICEPLEIGYRIDGEVLKITSRQRLEGELTVVTYSLADIVQPAGSNPTQQEVTQRLWRLEEVVPLVVEPGSWSEVGGQGDLHAYLPTLSLIVRQTSAVHRHIASLLEVLRGVRRTDVLMMKPGEVLWQEYAARLVSVTGHQQSVVQITATSPSAISVTGVTTGRTSFIVTDELGESRQVDVVVSESDADTAALLNVEEQIEQALDRRIELRVRQVPLNEALNTVSEQLGINIVLDEPGMNEYGVTATEEVSLSLRNIPARTVLELLLDPLQLGFVVQDEVVLVTNRARLQGQLKAVPYDVSDLISDDEKSVEADLEKLADLLRSTAAPESWQMVGGQGAIIVIPWKKLLVVTQSPARHEAVEAVLASLRQAQQGRPPE